MDEDDEDELLYEEMDEEGMYYGDMDEDELLYREMNKEDPWYMGDDTDEDAHVSTHDESHSYKGYGGREAYEESRRRQSRNDGRGCLSVMLMGIGVMITIAWFLA